MGWSKLAKRVLKQLPFKKLKSYDVVNGFFDVAAMWYTGHYFKEMGSPLIAACTWVAVVALCLVCVLWTARL